MSAPTNVWEFSIGGVQLTRFEVPDAFTVGHDMKFAEHMFIDEKGIGQVKTHFQGAFPAATEWKGTFTTANALSRAQQLDKLATRGAPVTFKYGPVSWVVNITQFHYTPKWFSEIDYEIKLCVVRDKTTNVTPGPLVTLDVSTQQFYDYGNTGYAALVKGSSSLPTSVTVPYSILVTSLQAAYPLSGATIPTLQSISSQIGLFLTGLAAYTVPLESTAVTEADMARLSACFQAQQGFGLLQGNINQLIGTSQTNTIVVSSSTSIYQLAATYYPNVDVTTAAQALYVANGLSDMIVAGGVTLFLPQLYNSGGQ